MEALALVLVALLALLIGAAIPVLVQLRATLREVAGAAAQTRVAVEEIRRLAAELQGSGAATRELLGSAADLAAALQRLKGSVTLASAVGAAVAPAVAAFVKTMREGGSEDSADGVARIEPQNGG